jgi:hypothetical protein
MKKIILFLLITTAFSINSILAQISDDNWDMLLIREDVVKTSQIVNYEEALIDLTLFLKEKKVNEVNYLTHVQDNYHYSHITVLKDLNEIEDGLNLFIDGKNTSDEFKLIWDALSETLESHWFYVVKYDHEYSFTPDGNEWLNQNNYRKWNYYYFEPGTEIEVDQILAAWKYLYKNKGVKNGYRIYRGAIGIDRPVVIFTSWAKTPLEHQQNIADNVELLGDEGSALWISMLELARKVETIEGWYLPGYSYIPK